MKPRHTYHMHCAKEWVIARVREYGAGDVLGPDWKGRDEEAIAHLEARPQPYVPTCDNPDEEGKCAGHPMDGAK